jgi:hypothetical protein
MRVLYSVVREMKKKVSLMSTPAVFFKQTKNPVLGLLGFGMTPFCSI